MEVAMVEAVLVSRYGPLNGCVCVCMDGYSEAGEYGNSKIWRQMRSGEKK